MGGDFYAHGLAVRIKGVDLGFVGRGTGPTRDGTCALRL
ncbi:hypothetical protein AWT69_001967 [Pseudomonas putida]|nr:hypothetical protein AWT69_001967 [Pseudomonas putida]